MLTNGITMQPSRAARLLRNERNCPFSFTDYTLANGTVLRFAVLKLIRNVDFVSSAQLGSVQL